MFLDIYMVMHGHGAGNLPSSIKDPIQLHMHAHHTGIIHTSCIASDSSLPATQESKQQAMCTDINVSSNRHSIICMYVHECEIFYLFQVNIYDYITLVLLTWTNVSQM